MQWGTDKLKTQAPSWAHLRPECPICLVHVEQAVVTPELILGVLRLPAFKLEAVEATKA